MLLDSLKSQLEIRRKKEEAILGIFVRVSFFLLFFCFIYFIYLF